MTVPLQVAFDDVQHSDAVEARVKEEVAKLEQFSARITNVRVVVVRPQNRHHKGDTFGIKINILLADAPGIAVSREPAIDDSPDDVYVTLREAFKTARRQLQDAVRKR